MSANTHTKPPDQLGGLIHETLAVGSLRLQQPAQFGDDSILLRVG